MLQIAVVVDSLRVPAWVANVVEGVATSPHCRLALVARTEDEDRCASRPGRRFGLFAVYRWLDARLSRARDNALRPVDLGKCCGPLPLAHWAIPAAGVEAGQREAIAELAAAGLDVLLDLSSRPLPQAIAGCARFGVWSYHDGEARAYADLPPLADEMYRGEPIAAAIVQCRTAGGDAARVLGHGTFILDRKSLFSSRNRSAWSGAAYLLRWLDELARRGWQHLQSVPTWRERDPFTKCRASVPTAGTTLRFVGRLARRRLERWSERFGFVQPWVIAYRAGEAGLGIRGEGGLGIGDWGLDSARHPIPNPQSPIPSLRFLLPPADRFYADPFPLEHDGRRLLYFEDSRHRPVKGVISYVELDASGRPSEPRTALETDCHLSYPFMFVWEGRPYMIPETFQHKRIELYRAEDFPGRWVLDRVLLDGVTGVDATLVEHEGRWWLFVSQGAPSGAFGPEVSLYYAQTPLGPWTPHPGNPVVTEVRQARPAGRPFLVGGRLIRPGQDCSVRWGYGISFNRVEILSPTDYRERAVARLGPDWFPGAAATHTYNRSPTVEVLDVQIPVRRKLNLLTHRPTYAQLCDRCRSDEFLSVVDGRLAERMEAIGREVMKG